MNVAVLAAGEIETYLALRPDQDPAEIRDRFEEGQHCYAVWQEGHIVHAQWAVTGRARIAYLGCHLELAPDEVYAYDASRRRARAGTAPRPSPRSGRSSSSAIRDTAACSAPSCRRTTRPFVCARRRDSVASR